MRGSTIYREYYANETDHGIKGFSEITKGHWYCGTIDIITGICHGKEVYCNIIDVGQRTSYNEAHSPTSPAEKRYTQKSWLF